jgi:hypothetical protein
MESISRFLLVIRKVVVDIDVTDSGCLPGMFVLAGSNNAEIREIVSDIMISKLEPFADGPSVQHVMLLQLLVDDWVRRFHCCLVVVVNEECLQGTVCSTCVQTLCTVGNQKVDLVYTVCIDDCSRCSAQQSTKDWKLFLLILWSAILWSA